MVRVTDTHDCPAGCGLRVPRRHYACRVDWYRLPWEVRERILAAYRGGLAGEHIAAMDAAQVWFDQNPPPKITRR